MRVDEIFLHVANFVKPYCSFFRWMRSVTVEKKKKRKEKKWRTRCGQIINFEETRESCSFLFPNIYIVVELYSTSRRKWRERGRERERDRKRGNGMKYMLACPLTRFLSKSRGRVRTWTGNIDNTDQIECTRSSVTNFMQTSLRRDEISVSIGFTMPRARIPRNIGQKNSSPLKIKRVEFVKILSSNSPSFFSARQIHARLLSLFLTNHLRARTHYVHYVRFFRFNDFWGDLSLGKRDPRIRGKTWMNGVKIWDIVRGPVFEGFWKGDRGKGAQPFICLAEACRVRAPRHTLTVSTNFTPNFQLARTPPDLHNILEIFYKISSLPPPFLRPSPSLARAQLPTPL